MSNFNYTIFTYKGITYHRYTGDRCKEPGVWCFYNSVPVNTVYITWPSVIQNDVTLSGKTFYSRIHDDVINVDFMDELSTEELAALDTLYTNHVAPEPA